MHIFQYKSSQSCREISAKELPEIYQASIPLFQLLDVCRLALNGNDERQRMADTLATCRQVLSQRPRPEPEDTIKLLRELLGLQKEEL